MSPPPLPLPSLPPPLPPLPLTVDLKFLGLFASNIQPDQALLAQSLFQLAGNLTMLAACRPPRRLWYALEALTLLDEAVLPCVAGCSELKVLAYKLRASCYHVQFSSSPEVSSLALAAFHEAAALADRHLWGSHPLRLSVKVDFAAFLAHCLHARAQSRAVATRTLADVYSAREGMDDDMFADAAQLVALLPRYT